MGFFKLRKVDKEKDEEDLNQNADTIDASGENLEASTL